MFSVGLHPCNGPKQQNKDLYRAGIYDIVPAGYRYYYLLDTAYSLNTDWYFKNKSTLECLTRIDPDFAAATPELHDRTDTVIYWSSYHLDKAIVIPNDTADEMFTSSRSVALVDYDFYRQHKDSLDKTAAYNEIFMPVRPEWGKRKIRRMVADYADTLEQTIPEERYTYFEFSKPIFSSDYKYAFIHMGTKDSNCLNVYKYDQGRWKKLATTFIEY